MDIPRKNFTKLLQRRVEDSFIAAVSAEPGYLSRRVTMASAGIKIDTTKKDCGTLRTFKLKVTDNLSKLLIGRYYMDGRKKVIIESENDIVGKTINLRSPLYCKSEKGICPTCYGRSYEDLNTKNIGILSGGAVNNAALNAYMSATRS